MTAENSLNQLTTLGGHSDLQVQHEDIPVGNTVEPGYNDICLYDTPPIQSDSLWYQLIRHC
jgi:hypothetical protein